MKKQYLIFSILLIIFVGVVFILTRFSMSSILSTEGYFISSNEIRNVLFNDEENLHVKKISLKKVGYEDNDCVFKLFTFFGKKEQSFSS